MHIAYWAYTLTRKGQCIALPMRVELESRDYCENMWNIALNQVGSKTETPVDFAIPQLFVRIFRRFHGNKRFKTIGDVFK